MEQCVAGSGSLVVTGLQGRRKSLVLLCCLSLTVWVAVVGLLWNAHGVLLNWDEVDYVNAASLGLWVNAFENGSLSPSQFIRFALSKISRRKPVLPADYNESRDPLVLRHYHPPFVVFMLSAVSRSRSERVIRSVQLLGALAFTCAIVFSYRSISASMGWSGLLLVSLLGLWMNQLLFGQVSFHGWAAVWTTTTAALLGRWLGAGKSTFGFLLCASLAVALLTLETGVFVWAGAILYLALCRLPGFREGAAAFPWRHLVVGVFLTVIVVVMVWPGSVVKVSLLKNPAIHVYRIWLGMEYSSVPVQMLLQSLLPMLILGPSACLWLFLAHRADFRRWGPFVVVSWVYGFVMTPFTHRPEYLIPALAPLACVVAVASDRVSSMWVRILVVVGSVFLVATAWPGGPTVASTQGAQEDLRWLQGVLRGRAALVDGGHIYQYYLGPDYAIRPITVPYNGDGLLVRERGAYRALGGGDITGAVVIIQRNRGRFFLGRAEETLLGRCSRIDRVSVRLYDCRGVNVTGSGRVPDRWLLG